MSASINSFGYCCGMSELDGIQHTSTIGSIKEIYFEQRRNGLSPFILFSDGTRGQPHGHKLARALRRLRFGRVWASRSRNNPTGSRHLKMWVFEPNYDTILRHGNKQGWGNDDGSCNDF